MDKDKYRNIARYQILLWIIFTVAIIAYAHVTIHMSTVAVVRLPGEYLLFLIPFVVSLAFPYVAGIDEIKNALYGGLAIGISSLFVIYAAFYVPSMLGVIMFDENYNLWTIKQVLVSAIAIIPATVVGVTIGGALVSD